MGDHGTQKPHKQTINPLCQMSTSLPLNPSLCVESDLELQHVNNSLTQQQNTTDRKNHPVNITTQTK